MNDVMKKLLLIRTYVVKIHSEYEVFLIPIVKFLASFLSITVINSQLGYMTMLNNGVVVLVAALACSFLPIDFTVIFSMLFALGHFYSLGIEALAVGGSAFLVLYLLLLRFVSKEKIAIAILPILAVIKMPMLIPVLLGLLGSPFSVITVGCGLMFYSVILNVASNAQVISSLGDEAFIQKVRLIVDSIIGDKAMLITIFAAVVTVIVVYVIRRLSINNSWTIAMIVGYATNLIILLIGGVVAKVDAFEVIILFTSLVSFGITKIVEFFAHNVDYSRIEKVQFEDDDYYYYVKAVPKIALSETNKKTKKINSLKK